jgi:hypothetical protein
VLGNKSDLTPHATNPDMIRALDLRSINGRRTSPLGIPGEYLSLAAPGLLLNWPLIAVRPVLAIKSQANLDQVLLPRLGRARTPSLI